MMYKIESYKYNTLNFYLFISNSNVRTRNASLKAFARCAETFKNENKQTKEEKESRREKCRKNRKTNLWDNSEKDVYQYKLMS